MKAVTVMASSVAREHTHGPAAGLDASQPCSRSQEPAATLEGLPGEGYVMLLGFWPMRDGVQSELVLSASLGCPPAAN